MMNCSQVPDQIYCPIFEFAVNGVGVTTCLLLGLTGNTIAIIHINRDYVENANDSPKHILRCLAVWDILLMTFIWCYYGLQHLFQCAQDLYQSSIFAYFTAVFHPLAATAFTASSFMAVLVSFKKYLVVCTPMSSTFKTSIFSSRNASVIVSVAAVLINIPSFFEARLETCWDSVNQMKKVTIEPSRLRTKHSYILYYKTLFRSILFTSAGPFCLCMVLSLATIVHVYRAYRVRLTLEERSSISSNRRTYSTGSAVQAHSVAAVSVLLIMKFMFSHVLPCFLDMWEALVYDRGDTKERVVFTKMARVSTILVAFNSATNCLVHLKCGKVLHRQLSKALRTISVGQALFSPKEVALLHVSWTHILEHTNQKFGHQLILAMLHRSPHFAEQLLPWGVEIDINDFDNDDGIKRKGETIDTFFGLLIGSLNETTSLKEIRDSIRYVGAVHMNAGVVISVDCWQHLKYWILQVVNDANAENVHGMKDGVDADEAEFERQVETCHKAWEHLVCMIIGEMRQGAISREGKVKMRRNALCEEHHL